MQLSPLKKIIFWGLAFFCVLFVLSVKMSKFAQTEDTASQSRQLEVETVTTLGPVLAWDANPEADIVGYRVRYGTSTGVHPQVLDVGNVTTATIPNLTPGTNYFFVVTAYNASLESPPSNEVMWIAVTPTPTPSPSPRQTPTPTPTPRPTATATATATVTPSALRISGNVLTCGGVGLATVTMTLTGGNGAVAVTDAAGYYNFPSVPTGGDYIVTPTIADLPPGNSSVNLVDVLAAQRHFTGITLLTGCQLLSADTNADTLINTFDVVAINDFYLSRVTATANVGKHRFIPSSRPYSNLLSDQAAQDYQALVCGDIVP